MFHDTIYYNISYGDLNASKEKVEEAAKMAELHESILRMPDGYNTRVCCDFFFQLTVVYSF